MELNELIGLNLKRVTHCNLATIACCVVISGTGMSIAAPLSIEMSSPIRRSFDPAHVAASPAQAMAIEIDHSEMSLLWNAETIRFEDMPMPSGGSVTLDLTPMDSPIEAFWLLSQDAFGMETREHIPAPAVLLLSGTVDGEPGSAAFLGISGDHVQGWIETPDGLHMISTPPDGGPTLMFRVGDARGGIDIPGPGPIKDVSIQRPLATENPFTPVTDLERLLVELQDIDSPVRQRFFARGGAAKIPELLSLVGGEIDPEDEPGACCIMPGFCLQLTAEWCGSFCESASSTFCNNSWSGPPVDFNPATLNLPPCWLGAGVPCGGMWTCFESFDDPSDPNNPANGNWIGPCCVVDPSTGIPTLQEMVACECAMEGGRFVAPPALCLGEDLAAPAEMDADNFVTLADIVLLDPNICSKPTGACCFEQQVLCEDFGDPNNPIYDMFERVTCLELPRSICEDAVVMEDTFNGTGEPGYFIKECFPCAASRFGDTVCPDSMQLETGGVAPPPQLECQSARLTVDTDWWFLDRFGGDANAAAAYSTMLLASVNWIFERDALVSFSIGDVLIRGAGVYGPSAVPEPPDPGDPPVPGYEDPDFLITGACCIQTSIGNGICRENRTEQWCAAQGSNATWLGPGSSCWDETGTPCVEVYPGTTFDIYNDQDATPFTIEDMWQQMRDEWNAINNSPGHPLHGTRTSSNLMLLLSGYPFERAYHYSDAYQEWGIEAQIANAGTGYSLCSGSANPYIVAAAKGTFPWPGEPFDRDDVNWDLVAVARGLGLAIGLSPNNGDSGYDNCDGPPCDDVRITTDCIHQYFYSALGHDMPATLMSYCVSCPGGSANLQLRFRAEQAAQLYARFASMDCGSSGAGGLDPSEPSRPYAVDDFYTELPGGGQYLDVLLNDIQPGCWSQNAFDPATFDPNTWDPAEDPWPEFPIELSEIGVPFATNPNPDNTDDLDWSPDGSPSLPADTIMGGTVDIVEDPSDPTRRVVFYTPPAEFCGIDYFWYRVTTNPPFIPDPNSPDPNNPDPLFLPETDIGFVRIVQEPCTGGKQDIHDLANYPPQSVTEPTVAPTPPPAGAADVIVIQGVSAASQLNELSWTNMVLQLVDPSSTSPSEAFLRVWGVRQAGVSLYDSDGAGVPYATFYDIHPFGTLGECGPINPFTWGGENPVGPSSGECIAPANFYTSTEGWLLLQCLEESDDLPGADALWIKGECRRTLRTVRQRRHCHTRTHLPDERPILVRMLRLVMLMTDPQVEEPYWSMTTH